MNWRGDGIGQVFGTSNEPFGGTVFLCNDTNTSTQYLPMVNGDHSSIRQMGNAAGGSVNVSNGAITGGLAANELELRWTRMVLSGLGYGIYANAPDAMISESEISGTGCGGLALGINSKITNNRIEDDGIGGGYCTAPAAAGTCAVTLLGGPAFPTNVVGNEFQQNGGADICMRAGGNFAVTGNFFDGSGTNGVAGYNTAIRVDNAGNNGFGGSANTGVTITGNTVGAISGTPAYFVDFEGTGDDEFTIGDNTLGANAYATAAYHFGTETPAHIKSVGNSGENDFVLGHTLSLGTMNATSGTNLDLGGGTSLSLLNSHAPLNGEFAFGTTGAPVASAGPNIKVSRTDNTLIASCANGDDSECNAALSVEAKGLSTETMNTVALNVSAQGAGTQAGQSTQGMNVVAISTAGSSIATAAFMQGEAQVSSAAVNTMEVRGTYAVNGNCTYSNTVLGQCTPLLIDAQGDGTHSEVLSSGMQIGSVDGKATFHSGITFDSGCCNNLAIDDNSGKQSNLFNVNVIGATAPTAQGLFDASGNLGLVASGATQMLIQGAGDGTNFPVFGGAAHKPPGEEISNTNFRVPSLIF
jgi:hypothetical protein